MGMSAALVSPLQCVPSTCAVSCDLSPALYGTLPVHPAASRRSMTKKADRRATVGHLTKSSRRPAAVGVHTLRPATDAGQSRSAPPVVGNAEIVQTCVTYLGHCHRASAPGAECRLRPGLERGRLGSESSPQDFLATIKDSGSVCLPSRRRH